MRENRVPDLTKQKSSIRGEAPSADKPVNQALLRSKSQSRRRVGYEEQGQPRERQNGS